MRLEERVSDANWKADEIVAGSSEVGSRSASASASLVPAPAACLSICFFKPYFPSRLDDSKDHIHSTLSAVFSTSLDHSISQALYSFFGDVNFMQ
jgi:hypothetical protein